MKYNPGPHGRTPESPLIKDRRDRSARQVPRVEGALAYPSPYTSIIQANIIRFYINTTENLHSLLNPEI
jgi:hypothetical protein